MGSIMAILEPLSTLKHLTKVNSNRLTFAHIALAYEQHTHNANLLQESPAERSIRHRVCTELIGSIISGARATLFQVRVEHR